MPMRDWTTVNPGVYHAFHNAWIASLQKAINDILPEGYYALGEQRSGEVSPDVLTLKSHDVPERVEDGTIALADAPPQVSFTQDFDNDLIFYLARQKQIAIRHTSDDEIVAVVEIVSPANKRSVRDLSDFVDKLIAFLNAEVHALIIDPFPPRRFDPNGIHGVIAEQLGHEFHLPADRPLLLSSYCVRERIKTFVEPYKVGDALHSMPIFLNRSRYLNVPLEASYQAALQMMPRSMREQ